MGNRGRGFTLAELVVIMAVISVLMGLLIPKFKGMQQEGQIAKVEGELHTLKKAVMSFWRNHSSKFPADLASLVVSEPLIVSSQLSDPFHPAGGTYGYIKGNDSNFGDYFVIYSKGPKGDTTSSSISFSNGTVMYSGSGRIISNAPVAKQ